MHDGGKKKKITRTLRHFVASVQLCESVVKVVSLSKKKKTKKQTKCITVSVFPNGVPQNF